MHRSSAKRISVQDALLPPLASRHDKYPTSSGPHGGALPRRTLTLRSSNDALPPLRFVPMASA
eukprot:CAMPEP_0185309944 /NCGR_PEP_ID=MMETSP1363-20130426/23005_1 /TAXON_ID=38817 /ORGANISM="Gephyrocapsa oceanica, Strain RCC1303" /LENGTH=62 /DNA_ID=CAMNT_0027907461 /DNA_START=336 /DNA_END=524 /DNA_ORIENTATION=-